MQRETVYKANAILDRIAQEKKYLEGLEETKATVPVCIEIWANKDEMEEIRQMKIRKIQRLEKELEELQMEKSKAVKANEIIREIERYELIINEIKDDKEKCTYTRIGDTFLILPEDVAECILSKCEERVKELDNELGDL